MIVSGGHLIGIDHVETDGTSILGDGVKSPLSVNPDLVEYYSAGPGIDLVPTSGDTEIVNTDHIFYESAHFDVVGDEMSAYIGNNQYIKFEVPVEVKNLTIQVGRTDDESTVSRSQFEFVKLGEEEDSLDDVTVLNEDSVECLMFAPMRWPGSVTYQGSVTNDIATILGYSEEASTGPWISTESGSHLVTSEGKHLSFSIV